MTNAATNPLSASPLRARASVGDYCRVDGQLWFGTVEYVRDGWAGLREDLGNGYSRVDEVQLERLVVLG